MKDFDEAVDDTGVLAGPGHARGALDRRVCAAPMLDHTDRHCRYFLRGFGASTLLYTEMITARAILHGDREHLLGFHPHEHPVALQLGGSDPQELAAAARAGEEAGYDEINLNCGCPSDRVVGGEFGACLMRQPERVAECVAAMRAAVKVPVTVKMRIGVITGRAGSPEARAAIAHFDEADFETLASFVEHVQAAGCAAAIVHARKAVLGGLSPKENREIPPLRYDAVYRLKAQFPSLPFVLNGGLHDSAAVLQALTRCDGVMLGREAYHRPWVLAQIHQALGGAAPLTREQMLYRMLAYTRSQLAGGARLAGITRHMLGLYSGEPGAREYRRLLSEGARHPGAGAELLQTVIARAAAGFLPHSERRGAPASTQPADCPARSSA